MPARRLNLHLSRRRLAVVGVTVSVAIALANAAPACSVSEPLGADGMNWTGVQRSLLQTEFKKSPQFGITESFAAEADGDSGAAEPPSLALNRKAQEHGRPPDQNSSRQVAAKKYRTGSVAEAHMQEFNNEQPLALTTANLPQELHVAVRSSLLEISHWSSLLGISSEKALGTSSIEGPALPYIISVVAGLAFIITFACLFSLVTDRHVQQPITATHLARTSPSQHHTAAFTPAGPMSSGLLGSQKDGMEAGRPPMGVPSHQSMAIGALKANAKFCPGLVVPEGQECVLAVRTFASAAAERLSDGAFASAERLTGFHPIALDVMDFRGQTVLDAHIAAPPPHPPSPMLVRLLTPSALQLAKTHIPDEHEHGLFGALHFSAVEERNHSVLCECRFGAAGRLNFYNASRELFGFLSRDPDSPRYSFVGQAGGPLLYFDGLFHDNAMVISNERSEHIADTEPVTLSFDPQTPHYKIRIGSGVDVGLILCGIFAIEAMEAAEAAKIVTAQSALSGATEAVVEALRLWDEDCDGYLSHEELMKAHQQNEPALRRTAAPDVSLAYMR